MRLALAAAALVAAAPHAQGARPMITDDARIVDAKACQVESWVKRNTDSTEAWALPACNFTGNLELTLGGARTNASGATRTTDEVLQGKTILHPLEERGWGAAFTLGTARHLQRAEATGWGDTYFNVPVSVALAGERWIAHFNGGASYRRDEKRAIATWGFGNEVLLSRETYLIPEVFRSESGKPFFQVGLRHWIVRDRLQLDATYGDRFGGERAHWISIGLRALTPPFLR